MLKNNNNKYIQFSDRCSYFSFSSEYNTRCVLTMSPELRFSAPEHLLARITSSQTVTAQSLAMTQLCSLIYFFFLKEGKKGLYIMLLIKLPVD